MVYVVHNPKTKQVWVFSTHAEALKCRRANKLNHWWLWGCSVDCWTEDR